MVEELRGLTAQTADNTIVISFCLAFIILIEELKLSKLSAQWLSTLLHFHQLQTRRVFGRKVFNDTQDPEVFLWSNVMGKEAWFCLLTQNTKHTLKAVTS